MTHPIIQKLRVFVTQLDYLTDNVTVFQKAKEPRSRRNNGQSLWEILSSASHPHAHDFRKLHQEVQVLQTSDPTLRAIQSVWNAFHDSIRPENSREIQRRFEELSSHLPMDQRLGEFWDTDLVLYPDDAPSEDFSSTFNGIEESEFVEVLDLYHTFMSRLTIQDGADLNFIQLVKRDIRMILSRPLGRDLIRLINEKPIQLTITKTPHGSKFQRRGNQFTIQYSTADHLLFHHLTEELMRAGSSPSFIMFAHELIHLYHNLYGISRDRTPDPKLNRYQFEDKFEHLTILGTTPSGDITDPIFENSIRRQFGLPERYTHHGFSSDASLDTRIGSALFTGSTVDLEQIFRTENIAPKNLNTILQMILKNDRNISSIDPSYIQRLLECAAENPHFQLQQSPLHPLQERAPESATVRIEPALSAPPPQPHLAPHSIPHLQAPRNPSWIHPPNCPGCPDPSHRFQSAPMVPQPMIPFQTPSLLQQPWTPLQSAPPMPALQGTAPHWTQIPLGFLPSYNHPANCPGCPHASHQPLPASAYPSFPLMQPSGPTSPFLPSIHPLPPSFPPVAPFPRDSQQPRQSPPYFQPSWTHPNVDRN
jgi:hypothetical protein